MQKLLLSKFHYHRAGVKSFDALHDFSLALLATVLLPVDPGIAQLLHYLQQKPITTGTLRDYFRDDIFTCEAQVELIISNNSSLRYCTCWVTSTDF